jgi:acyl-CoA thioesterase I
MNTFKIWGVWFRNTKIMKHPIIYILSFLMLTSCGSKQENGSNVDSAMHQSDDATQINDQSTQSKDTKTILFFGDSLTAGYGLDEEEAFPALIQKKIDSLGLSYHVVNAGLSGETSSGGKNRIEWILNQPVDIFILELGANDMLRGLDVKETKINLEAILESVRTKHPNASLMVAGMLAAPNMGEEYTREFNAIFPNLAKKYNATLIPFLLNGVATLPELNLPDGKHPNIEGQQIVANNVWKYLEGLVE